MATSRPLMIVLTSGLEDGGRRAALAFGAALAALADGDEVHVFLSLQAAVLGTPTGCAGVQPPGFSEPLETYIGHFVDLGGRLEVCSSCYEEYCRGLPRDSTGRPTLRPNTTIRGLSVVAARAHQMPTVTF
jgi:predicted peroxiredoxin